MTSLFPFFMYAKLSAAILIYEINPGGDEPDTSWPFSPMSVLDPCAK